MLTLVAAACTKSPHGVNPCDPIAAIDAFWPDIPVIAGRRVSGGAIHEPREDIPDATLALQYLASIRHSEAALRAFFARGMLQPNEIEVSLCDVSVGLPLLRIGNRREASGLAMVMFEGQKVEIAEALTGCSSAKDIELFGAEGFVFVSNAYKPADRRVPNLLVSMMSRIKGKSAVYAPVDTHEDSVFDGPAGQQWGRVYLSLALVSPSFDPSEDWRPEDGLATAWMITKEGAIKAVPPEGTLWRFNGRLYFNAAKPRVLSERPR